MTSGPIGVEDERGASENRGRVSRLLLGNALSAIPLDMYKFRK
jgi:hypothetical protein